MNRNVEIILSHVNIVEEISSFVKLKKTGQNYSGLCPFHAEKTPSFSVNESKGFYYCFGCGKGGNVINFLKEIRGESFGEIVEYLKGKYNIPLETTKFYDSRGSDENKDPARKILRLALDFFFENLFVYKSASLHASRYIAERGISQAIAKEFKLGYAGFGNGLTALLYNNKADMDLAAGIGLIRKNESQPRFSDRFINKLIIPIMDRSGDPIAFASRMLPGDNSYGRSNYPKYVNTNNSDVFVKNNSLFGLDKSLPYIKKENSVFIVEGYFDMITLYSRGLKNVVATMGTALSKNHILNLSRICDEIVLLYDGDKAGINAINRGMELFEGFMDDANKNIYAVCINDGSDPDSFVRKHGSDPLKKLIINNKKTPVDFILDYYTLHPTVPSGSLENNPNNDIIKNKGGLAELKEKSAVIKNIAPFIRKINNEIVFSHYINLLANRLGLKESSVRDYVFQESAIHGALSNSAISDTAVVADAADNITSRNTEDLIIQKIFNNLLLTEYISDDIIHEFSDEDAVFIIREIKNLLDNDVDLANSGLGSFREAAEEIIGRTKNNSKWREIYYSGLMEEDAESAESSRQRSSFKKLLIKLKVDNLNKTCSNLLSEIKSGFLDENGRLLKLRELNRLKSVSNEFQKKLAII